MPSHPRHRAPTTSIDDAAPPGERAGHGERGVGGSEKSRTVEPADPAELAVDLRGVHKSFGKAHVLNGVDLQIPRGVIAGFLGPNGSGKSTTLAAVEQAPPHGSAVVVFTRATLPAAAPIAIVPVASGAGRSTVPPVPSASATR